MNNKIKWFIGKGSDMNLLRSTWKQREQVSPTIHKKDSKNNKPKENSNTFL